jgi:1-pyrroline-5-carboxylate dehydrogenase
MGTATHPERGAFRNEPLTDFSKPENKKAMEQALAKVKSELGREYPLLIDGEEIRTGETTASVNPSHPDQVIGRFQKGTPEHAHRAIEAAHRAFDPWKRVPAAQRAECLFRAADILRKRRFEISAWMIYEVGKTWPEADADIAEAIDFCEFYGREMIRLSGPQPVHQVPGEKNVFVYIPLGAGAVIPPWNFPSAIPCGMTVAALVAGNTVVLKPSGDSAAIAWQLVQALYEAGIPKSALHFLTGPGSSTGEALIADPKTRFIAFTGSKEVGLRISELAGKAPKGQIWIKRTVLEMGGKDAIIVDDEADIDAAVDGVTVSAFGYQGQKCSACSRAIVTEKVYKEFVDKLTGRVQSIKVGPSEDPGNYMGPVINAKALKSMEEYIEIGKKEGGKLVAGGKRAPGDGYFLEPTVIVDVKPDDRIAQEEIFGPVLAVIPAKDFDDALKIANGTEFGLTGALFSKNPQKIARAAEDFHVGNLYFNRKCTGALVGVQPFGGFNMSGTDSKAGGQDYLLLFLQGKSLAERLPKS